MLLCRNMYICGFCSSSQPAKVSVGGGDMSVLSMPHMADQQQQQQTLPTDQYGYSTAQPWPPVPQVSLVTLYHSVVLISNLAIYGPISSLQFANVHVGGADMSLLSIPSLPQGKHVYTNYFKPLFTEWCMHNSCFFLY